MSPNLPTEQLIQQIHALNRSQCIRELLGFKSFPLDFTPTYLKQMSVERLRHLLMAAMLTAHRR